MHIVCSRLWCVPTELPVLVTLGILLILLGHNLIEVSVAFTWIGGIKCIDSDDVMIDKLSWEGY